MVSSSFINFKRNLAFLSLLTFASYVGISTGEAMEHPPEAEPSPVAKRRLPHRGARQRAQEKTKALKQKYSEQKEIIASLDPDIRAEKRRRLAKSAEKRTSFRDDESSFETSEYSELSKPIAPPSTSPIPRRAEVSVRLLEAGSWPFGDVVTAQSADSEAAIPRDDSFGATPEMKKVKVTLIHPGVPRQLPEVSVTTQIASSEGGQERAYTSVNYQPQQCLNQPSPLSNVQNPYPAAT